MKLRATVPRFKALSACLAAGFSLSLPAAAGGPAPQPADMSSMGLEDLMQIEVSSAARKTQRMADTAAAAYVISNEDIRRSGATTIMEALRLAPGLQVARVGASGWAITARGFNGQYANKLLVLIDGRTVYTPVFSGVFWDLQDTFMEDIERIEVIRGPGAAMWGANAVNGVINIITRAAGVEQGKLLEAGVGGEERGFAGLRHAAAAGDGAYRLYAKAFDRNAAVDKTGQRLHDDWRGAQAGFRAQRKLGGGAALTVQGDGYVRKVGNESFSNAVLVPPYQRTYVEDNDASGANLMARWEQRLPDQSELVVQAYVDRVRFSAPTLGNVQDTFDLDTQLRFAPSLRHDIMMGGNVRHIRGSATNSADIAFTPAARAYTNASIFVQDDIALVPERVRLTVGGKFEKPHFGQATLQPNVRLLWTPDGATSLWAAVSRASRTPSVGESESRIALAVLAPGSAANPLPFPIQVATVPDPAMRAERLTSVELGLRTQLAGHVWLDVAAFSNTYRELSTLSKGAPAPAPTPVFHVEAPFYYGNARDTARTRGVELVAEWRVREAMRIEGSYTYLRVAPQPVDFINNDPVASAPRGQSTLRWQSDLDNRTQLDFWLRHVGKLGNGSTVVPAYSALDARLGYAVKKGLELALVGQNLLNQRHAEFARSDGALRLQPRSLYLKATWRY